MINKAKTYDKVLNKTFNRMAYAASQIDDGTDGALATAINAYNTADELAQRTSDRNYQMNRTQNRIDKQNASGKGGRGGAPGKVNVTTPSKADIPVGSKVYNDKKISELQQQLDMACQSSEQS